MAVNNFIGTYDPSELAILINGDEVFGFAEGEMVTIEKVEEHFNVYTGTLGETTRARVLDNNYRVTFRLQQTSPFIDTFEKYKITNNVATLPPVVAMQIKDPSSYDGFFAASAWLQVDPSRSWSNEVGVREYVFFAVGGITSDDQVNVALNIATSIGVV